MQNNSVLYTLLKKLHLGELTPDEENVLNKMLSSDDEALNLFKKDNLLHESIEALRIDTQKPPVNLLFSKANKFHKFRDFAIKVAVSLTIPIIIGLSIFYVQHFDYQQSDKYFSEIISPYNNRAVVKLSDGSEVILMSGSKLIYPAKFKGKERNVILEGEAVFNVSASVKSPFYVNNIDKSTRVKAYGTRFRVINYPLEKSMYVYLSSGKVNFTAKSLDDIVALTPGNELEYIKETNSVNVKEASNKYESLEKGLFVYENTPLSQLVAELNRRFPAKVSIVNSKISNIKFTGVLSHESLDEIVQMIIMSSPSVKYQKEGDAFILF